MNNRPEILIIIFIAKLLVLLSLPVYTIVVREKNQKVTRFLVLINIIFISLFVALNILNNNYMVNSTIKGIKNSINSTKYTDKEVTIYKDPNVVEKIVTNKIYNTKNGTKVYYFNNNTSPLKDKKIDCDNSYVYFKNVGNNITSISTFISTELNQNIDPLEIINLAIERDIFDCERGVDTGSLLNLISEVYNVSIREIDYITAVNSINTGKIVLTEIDNNGLDTSLSCGKSNMIIYNTTNDGNFNILLPDDRDYDYICPDNTKGYGIVLKANANEGNFNVDDIYSIIDKYYIIER